MELENISKPVFGFKIFDKVDPKTNLPICDISRHKDMYWNYPSPLEEFNIKETTKTGFIFGLSLKDALSLSGDFIFDDTNIDILTIPEVWSIAAYDQVKINASQFLKCASTKRLKLLEKISNNDYVRLLIYTYLDPCNIGVHIAPCKDYTWTNDHNTKALIENPFCSENIITLKSGGATARYFGDNYTYPVTIFSKFRNYLKVINKSNKSYYVNRYTTDKQFFTEIPGDSIVEFQRDQKIGERK